MFFSNIKSEFDLRDTFPDEQSCIDHLEKMRWNGNVKSPYAENAKVWKLKNNRYRCGKTKKDFNVRTGTLFGDSNISLRKWFLAIWKMTSEKKGKSSIQLGKALGVTQATAWFMAKRIRNCFCLDEEKAPLTGTVELDETFVGGKNKNRHKDKKVPMSRGRAFIDKTPVLGILQRGNELRCFVVKDTSAKSIIPHVLRNVSKDATVITDEWTAYGRLHHRFNHHIVNHAKKEYVSMDNREIHSNTIEGFWSILKRGIIGIYHIVSRKRLQFYVNEFVFRYNTRKMKEGERFTLFLQNIGHRLKYKDLIAMV